MTTSRPKPSKYHQAIYEAERKCAHDGYLTKGPCDNCFASEIERVAADAVREERKATDKIVDGMELTGPGPIGPLWDIGWTSALGNLRERLLKARTPDSGEEKR